MDLRRDMWTNVILLSFMASVSGSETEQISVIEGHSVTLHTNLTEILNQDTIMWLFGPNQWVVSEIERKDYFTSFFKSEEQLFRGKLQVDQKTGSISITNSRVEHSGVYELLSAKEKSISKTFNVTVL
ncbi:hypothetical protein DNTS_027927, partial [Danionella cerebrum]